MQLWSRVDVFVRSSSGDLRVGDTTVRLHVRSAGPAAASRRWREHGAKVLLLCLTAMPGCATTKVWQSMDASNERGMQYDTAARAGDVLAITYASRCEDWIGGGTYAWHPTWARCDLAQLRWSVTTPADRAYRLVPVNACVEQGSSPADVVTSRPGASTRRFGAVSPDFYGVANDVDAGGGLLVATERGSIVVWSRDPREPTNLRVGAFSPPSWPKCPNAGRKAMSVAVLPAAVLFDVVTLPGQVAVYMVVAILYRGVDI